MYESLRAHRARPHDRHTLQDRHVDHRMTFDSMVVSRRLGVGADRIAEVLGDEAPALVPLDDGRTVELGPMTPAVPLVGSLWRGRARIRRRGSHLLWPIRFDVEVSALSADAGALRISPISRRAQQWGSGRLRRYFATAHSVADHLWREFHAPDPLPVLVELPAIEPVAAGPRRSDSAA